jgi:hypothetical protein
MKISNSGICCNECFDLIARKSTLSAKLWIDLCDLYLKSNVFGLRSKDFKELRILELLEFIITTETSDFILVKVLGQCVDHQGVYFCGGYCNE